MHTCPAALSLPGCAVLQMLDMLEEHFEGMLGREAVERIDVTTPSAKRHSIIRAFNQPSRWVIPLTVTGQAATLCRLMDVPQHTLPWVVC